MREVNEAIIGVNIRDPIAKIGATSSSAPYSSEAVNEEAVTKCTTNTAGGGKIITATLRVTTALTSPSGVVVAKDSHL